MYAIILFAPQGPGQILSTSASHTVAPVVQPLCHHHHIPRSYIGIRRAPNCIIQVDTSKGCGDGFLRLEVRTRNAGGVATKGLLLVNFGPTFDDGRIVDPGPETKKFKRVLENYFSRQAPYCSVCMDVHVAPKIQKGPWSAQAHSRGVASHG